MKQYFLKLYQYNAWANNRVMKCLLSQQVEHDKVLTLMSHLISAQLIWLARIEDRSPAEFHLWKQRTMHELKEMTERANTSWLDFIEKNDNFNREMSYLNFKGLPFKNNVGHIMMHLVNHSTYHRGQIAFLLRENGYEPVNTDFITYDRIITGQLND